MKQLSNKDKLNYVYRVAIKCKTFEQFKVVRQWGGRIPLDGTLIERYNIHKHMFQLIDAAEQNVFKWDKE